MNHYNSYHYLHPMFLLTINHPVFGYICHVAKKNASSNKFQTLHESQKHWIQKVFQLPGAEDPQIHL